MLRELVRVGADPSKCEAKIFGGGNMFPDKASDETSVGVKNGRSARRLLSRLGLNIVSESLYGIGHRNIIFDIASGDVWVRQIKPISAAQAQARMAA
jgi:chemotaxis protein CheD